MTDPVAAQRAREWLEHQLAELGQLRNATRRDQHFKTWRQQTLTVIQRIWPGDSQRVDRFRRIPFTPPTAHTTDRQMREYYERGWGEAGVLLRGLIAEVNLLGLPRIQAPGTRAGSETESAMGPMPSLDHRDASRAAAPEVSGPPAPAGDDFGRAMDRLLGGSSRLRRPPSPAPPAPAGTTPEPGTPAAELMEIAGELEALGLSPAQAGTTRETLLALARVARPDSPPWELVSRALADSGATPALARRVLPLLLEFIARAA